jgi:hypothetical protein
MMVITDGRDLWMYCCDGLRLHDTPIFIAIGSVIQLILRLLLQHFRRLQCSYYWWKGFMKCAVALASCGMIYIPVFMMISSVIQVILRLLPQHLERLQCWYYWGEGFMKYTIEMATGSMLYIPCFMKINTVVKKLLGIHVQTDGHARTHTWTARWSHKHTSVFSK